MKSHILFQKQEQAIKKIPTHQIIKFEGSIADLQQVNYDARWLYYEFEKLAPDTLWTAVQSKIQNIEHTLTRQNR